MNRSIPGNCNYGTIIVFAGMPIIVANPIAFPANFNRGSSDLPTQIRGNLININKFDFKLHGTSFECCLQ